MVTLDLCDEDIEEIREILGELYLNYGSTPEVIRLSQWVDEIMVSTQKERQCIYIELDNKLKIK